MPGTAGRGAGRREATPFWLAEFAVVIAVGSAAGSGVAAAGALVVADRGSGVLRAELGAPSADPDDRVLPPVAARGAGVRRRVLVRVLRRPFCPSEATPTFLPNAGAAEAPMKMGSE
jgi:hypothetical protein